MLHQGVALKIPSIPTASEVWNSEACLISRRRGDTATRPTAHPMGVAKRGPLTMSNGR